MATINWPGALPQTLLLASYRDAMPTNAIVDQFEAGPAGYRRRVSQNVYPVSGSMIMTTAEWEDLQLFITDDLLDRQYAFGFPAQGDDASPPNEWLVLMADAPTRAWLAEDLWEVSVNLLVLPTALQFGATTTLLPELYNDPDIFYIATIPGVGSGLALVTKSADQTAANYNAETNVVWQTEIYDVGGWHSGSNSFFTVPTGVSFIRLNGSIYGGNNNAGGSTRLRFGKGGTPWTAFVGEAGLRNAVGSTTPRLSIQGPIIPVTPGDVFDLLWLTTSDTSTDVIANRSSFSVEGINSSFSGALVYKSGSQSGDFATAAAAVTFDTESYDQGGWFNSGVSTTRFTVPNGIDYVRVTAGVGISSFTGGQWAEVMVRKNGAMSVGCPAQSNESSTTNLLSCASGPIPVVEGDYLECFVKIEADTSIVVDVNNTFFAIEGINTDSFSGALIYRSANGTFDFSLDKAVAFDAESIDVGGEAALEGWHRLGTRLNLEPGCGQFIVPAGVKRIRLTATLDMDAFSVGGVTDQTTFRKNLNAVFAGTANQCKDITAAPRQNNIASAIIDVVPGDVFEVFELTSDTTVTIVANTSWFSVETVERDDSLTFPYVSGFAGCLAYPGTDLLTQNITTGTYDLPCDTEAYDVGGWHSTSSDTDRMIVPAGVWYVKAWGGYQFPSTWTAASPVQLSININGGIISGIAARVNGSATNHGNVAMGPFPVVPGDFIECHLEGGDASTTITSQTSFLAVQKVNPATFKGARVEASASQTANFTTATALNWDKVVYDRASLNPVTGGWFSAGSPTKLTVPSGVDYVRVYAAARVINAGGADWGMLQVRKNGSTTGSGFHAIKGDIGSSTAHQVIHTGVIPVSQGDYFEIYLQVEADISQSHGGSICNFTIEAIPSAGFSGAMVTKTANQTGANFSTATTVSFNSEYYDVGGWHDNTTQNTRLTVPSGVSRVQAHATLAVQNISAADFAICYIIKNGAGYPGMALCMLEGATTMFYQVLTPPIDVTAGDYFELIFDTQSDTSIDIIASQTTFSIVAVPDD